MKKNRLKIILVGFFGIAILLASYWGFNYLKGTNLFKQTNTYYVIYERIDGLTTSASVTVNGFQVGLVDDIELLPGHKGQIKVTISIRQEIKIPKGSVARIYSMDLMGTKGIELIFSETDNIHKPEETLKDDIEKSLREEVSYQMIPLKNQVEGLIGEIQDAIEIISYIFNQETRDNLEKSFESIRNTFSHLESSAITLDTLFLTQEKRLNDIFANVASITTNIRKSNEQISNIINNISGITDSLAVSNIANTINEANNAIENFNSIVEKINKGEGTLGALLHDDKLYYDLDNAAKSLDKLLIDLRLNPKKYINFSVMNIGRTITVSDESELSTRDLRRLERQREQEEKIRQKNLEKEQKGEEKSKDN